MIVHFFTASSRSHGQRGRNPYYRYRCHCARHTHRDSSGCIGDASVFVFIVFVILLFASGY